MLHYNKLSMLKKIAIGIVVLCLLCISITGYTQQTTQPLQFRFSVSNLPANKVLLRITATIEKGTKLIAVSNDNNPLKSTLSFDSSSIKNILDSLESIGNTKSFIDNAISPSPIQYYTDSITWMQYFRFTNTKSESIKGVFNYIVLKNGEYITGEKSFIIPLPLNNSPNHPSIDVTTNEHKSLLSIFVFSFLAGLLAVLTPCVFPLIPVTVSFFLKRSKTRVQGIRSALWYSISIISIYTIPTLLLTLLFGDKIVYTISTHPISNIFFFLIFILFAISFFGAFDIRLPNSWANVSDKVSSRGGWIGIFFMALTLVIVSFSCTGPLIGTLLGQTSTKGISLAPLLGMFGFAIGLALPFSIFAFLPSLLKALPKSGAWLNSVKVIFGFIELALAFKFLSNVDLAYHWHLLDREIFLIIWIVIFTLLGLYLLGKLKFAHDSEVKFVSVPRLFLSISSLAFALYMIPGLWGAPLKSISGWLPPISTQDFNLQKLQYQLDNISSNASLKNKALPPNKYTKVLHPLFGITTYFDLEEALAAAKMLNKPVMLDFTGHSCANCRKMENEVWSNPEVLKRLKNDFIIVSLYVDDQITLSIAEQYVNAKGEHITTLGEKNLDYEVTTFGFNAQPLYMFLDAQGNILSDVKYGYDSDTQKFIDHLEMIKKLHAQNNT